MAPGLERKFFLNHACKMLAPAFAGIRRRHSLDEVWVNQGGPQADVIYKAFLMSKHTKYSK
jgi:hypothetical protein